MSFLGEIKRRKVFQVAAVYAVVAWLIIQIVDVVNDPLSLPDWFDTVTILFLGIGFPITIVMSWAFDIGPSGVVRDRNEGPAPAGRGHRLEIVLLVLLVVAVGWIAFRELNPSTSLPDGAIANSVAALPFGNLGIDNEDARSFADGMHGELLTQLAKIRSLTSISRTSVLQYRDTEKSMREIGTELGVAAILEGNVQRAAGMVQVRVSLIDAASDRSLWAESYNETFGTASIFAIQSAIATAIAAALEATLTPEEAASLEQVPTDSDVAWDSYRRGDDYFWRSDFPVYTPLAITMFERAIEADENFAHAWAALSRAHVRMYYQSIDSRPERREQARLALLRAFELNRNLPEAYLARGVFEYMGHRAYATALADLEIAERGMPNAIELYIARADIYRRLDNWDESIRTYERAIELDPRNSFLHWNHGFNYVWKRDYARADALAEHALSITPDDFVPYSDWLHLPLLRDGDASRIKDAVARPIMDLGTSGELLAWIAAIFEGDYRMALSHLDSIDSDTVIVPRIRVAGIEGGMVITPLLRGMTLQLDNQTALANEQLELARTLLAEMIENNPSDPWILLALGETLARLGEHSRAVDLVEQSIALLPVIPDAIMDQITRLSAAYVLALTPESDTAVQMLDEYLSVPGMWSIEGLARDPRLDPIRDDPRFQALVEKYSR